LPQEETGFGQGFSRRKATLEQIHNDVQELYANLRMDTLKARLAELESETFSPDFWNDRNAVRASIRKSAS
jgi:hypothetical protein